MLATLHTRMFDQEYEISLLVREEGPYCLKMQITMNDVIVEEKFVKPTVLQNPGEVLVHWLYSRYRGQFNNFAVEVQ